jgi:hypothetical protein
VSCCGLLEGSEQLEAESAPMSHPTVGADNSPHIYEAVGALIPG